MLLLVLPRSWARCLSPWARQSTCSPRGGRALPIGMGVAAIVIGVSDNVIRPWVQSVDTRMHPLVTLLALFGE